MEFKEKLELNLDVNAMLNINASFIKYYNKLIYRLIYCNLKYLINKYYFHNFKLHHSRLLKQY